MYEHDAGASNYMLKLELKIMSQFILIYLFNVHQRALPIERIAVCMNECMCECCDKTRGFSIFRI